MFCATYRSALADAFRDFPEEYRGSLETTYNKMVDAFGKGTYNKDSRAIKATCKNLGIKHTYKAIKAYLKG